MRYGWSQRDFSCVDEVKKRIELVEKALEHADKKLTDEMITMECLKGNEETIKLRMINRSRVFNEICELDEIVNNWNDEI